MSVCLEPQIFHLEERKTATSVNMLLMKQTSLNDMLCSSWNHQTKQMLEDVSHALYSTTSLKLRTNNTMGKQMKTQRIILLAYSLQIF
jgi:hypothetical protein